MTITTEKVVTAFEVDANDFFSQMLRINQSLDKMANKATRSSTKIAKSNKILTKSYTDLHHKVRDLGMIVGGLGKAYAGLLVRGGRLDKMLKGQTVEVETASKALKGLVSKYDLVQQSNMAVAFGVASTGKQFAKLTSLAAVTAQKLGIDVHDATSRVIRGVGKMEVELLDELGIRVRLNEALDMHARKLGKSKSALSQNERQTALLNDVLQKLEHNAGGVGVKVNTAGDAFIQLKVAMTDGLDALSKWLTGSESMRDWIASVTKTLRKLIDTLKEGERAGGSAATKRHLKATEDERDTLKKALRAEGLFPKMLRGKLAGDIEAQAGKFGKKFPRGTSHKAILKWRIAQLEARIAPAHRALAGQLVEERKMADFAKAHPGKMAIPLPGGGGKGKKSRGPKPNFMEFEFPGLGSMGQFMDEWETGMTTSRAARTFSQKAQRKRDQDIARRVSKQLKQERAEKFRQKEQNRKFAEEQRRGRMGRAGMMEQQFGGLMGMFGTVAGGQRTADGKDVNQQYEKYVEWMHKMATSTSAFDKAVVSVAGTIGELGSELFPTLGAALYDGAKAWGAGKKGMEDFGKAMLATFLDSFGKRMMLKSMEHAAEGLGALARWDLPGAGMHAAAAAAFGVAAAAAGYGAGALSKKSSQQTKKKSGVDRGMGRTTQRQQSQGASTLVYNINTITPPDPDGAAAFIAGTIQHAKNMGLNIGT